MEEVPEECPICGRSMLNGYEWINVDECICYLCYEKMFVYDEYFDD